MLHKKIICLVLCLGLLCSLIPTAAATDLPDYDVEAAITYAQAHWNDKVGECAQFVSTCLAAGGIIIPNSYAYFDRDEPRYWGSTLGEYTNPYICAAALLKYLSQYYEVIVDPRHEDMELGDVIFMTATNPDGHAGIITSFHGSMPLYTAHNGDCLNAPVDDLANFLVKMTPVRNELCDKGDACGGNQFRDMPAPDDWSHAYIEYVVEQNLFDGTSKNTFSPNGTMTRAMLVTVLWRYDGSAEGFEANYADVVANSWYADAVGWATALGIVDGVGNGRFSPDAPVTREQVATILMRYVRRHQMDSGARSDFAAFDDGERVSDWAVDAMQWAVAEGLISGSSSNGLWLLPQNSATRAQVAAILTRFIQNL